MKRTNAERRNRETPIPDNLVELLTAEQQRALPELEEKGVTLVAVRRPLFQEPVVIVKLQAREMFGVLLENGDVDYFAGIPIREQPSRGIGFAFTGACQGLD